MNCNVVKNVGNISSIFNHKPNSNNQVSSDLQEFGPNARIRADSLGDLADVRPRPLADGREGVDAGYPLCEEGVCRQLGELRGPRAHGQNLLPVDLGNVIPEFTRIKIRACQLGGPYIHDECSQTQ